MAARIDQLALTRLEAGVLFVDHEDPTFTADHTAVFVTLLQRFERISNTHRSVPITGMRG
jgi:hypothetical protein